MSNEQRLGLMWICKDNQPKLEPRILIEDPEKSYGHTPNPRSRGECKSPLLGGDLGVGNTAGDSGVGSRVKNLINQIAKRQQAEILQMNAERNAGFFDTEMEKLDRWAEDVKSSLEIELKELDKEIKYRKTEAKKILNLEEKVTAHRQIKEMEKKRNTMRLNLYQTQDDVDSKKEQLIEEIEARLKQKIETTELFAVRWKVI